MGMYVCLYVCMCVFISLFMINLYVLSRLKKITQNIHKDQNLKSRLKTKKINLNENKKI